MVQVSSEFDALAEELPENLQYILKNRLRISRALDNSETMQLVGIC
jgi:hypothetical protein